MKILVSTINWNNARATNNCLAGIAALDRPDQPDVVVIDNGSDEQFSVDPAVKKKLRSLKVVLNDSNLGFAGGHNPQINFAVRSGYGYIVILNNDAEIIDKGIFKKLAAALDSNQKAIGANPTILSSLKPARIWYAGGRLSLKTGAKSHLRVGQELVGLPGDIQKTGLLTGGCLMIRLKDIPLDQLLLNDDYFMYWEDTDWCARARRAGYELLYVPQAQLLHHVSSSLGVRSPTYIYYVIRNHFMFIRYNLSPAFRPLGWLIIFGTIAKYKLNIIFRYRQHRLKAFKALYKGYWDGVNRKTGKLDRGL